MIGYFLDSNNGLMTSNTLLVAACLLFMTYIITMIYPALKSSKNFKNMTKDLGGPKGHWFFGDAVTVSFNYSLFFLS